MGMNNPEEQRYDWHTRAESAAHFLTETDRQVAELRQKYEKDKRQAKRVWSAIFLRVDGNIEERKAQCETNPDYDLAQAAEMTSLLEWEALRNRRDTANTVIEFWRSWNKAKTEGQI